MLPDADILVGAHRTWSHSLCAALAFSVLVAVLARAARFPVARTTVLCGLAYASHVLLDWLGKDTADPRGIMAFWPISRTYFISGLDLFPEVSRRYWKPDEFIWGNLRSVAIELLILGPPCLLIVWWQPRGHSSLRRAEGKGQKVRGNKKVKGQK
jgi:hypothetical protein